MRRTALLALAMAFVVIAWVWDGLAAVGRALAGFIPWARFKQAFAKLVDRLPAPLVLMVFLVPFLIVEPLLVGATIAIAMGYVLSGAIAWIVLKFLAVALIPAIFDLTKHKLMTMPWFVRAYEKVMAFHHYAEQIVAPYKNAAAAVLRQWRMRAAVVTRRVPGLAHLAARFASRKRASGRPPLAERS
ncbi:MAG TPA: hypothetical protein VNY10_23615 [Roseiarcus sp.]|nr:hypothetical protein [Roseiarcus sp.]